MFTNIHAPRPPATAIPDPEAPAMSRAATRTRIAIAWPARISSYSPAANTPSLHHSALSLPLPIKAKTPAIKANRASSRHPLKFLIPLSPPIINLAFSLQYLAFCLKTPVIVPHQALSRHTMKYSNNTPPSANGAAPYQPRATPWVCTPDVPSPEGAAHPANQAPNQGKTPSNQGSSCFIKANAKKHASPWTLGAWSFSGAWNLELTRPNPFAPLRLRAFALKPRHQVTIKAQSRQKTPVIVHHQGISRHPLKMKASLHDRAPLPPALDVGCFGIPPEFPLVNLP